MHKVMLFLALTVGVGLAIPCWAPVLSAAEGQEVPALEAPKIEAAPTIDGDLSDEAWKQAARFAHFRLYDKDRTATTPTTAFICYDDQALYAAFICDEPQTDKLKAQATVQDGKPPGGRVSADDCVELFVVPGHPRGNYYHFIINSRNVRLDQRNGRWPQQWMDTNWDGEWVSAAKVNPGKNWVVEMAIPWHNFAADLGKKDWAVQFCRAKLTEPVEFSAYTFVNRNFHNERAFTKITPPQVDLARFMGFQLYGVEVENYEVEAKGYAYTVKGTLKSEREQKVRLMVRDAPEEGKLTEATQEITLPAYRETPFAVRLGIRDLGPRKILFQLADAASGAPLYLNAADNEVFPWLLRMCIDRSFYTSENTANAIFAINVPEIVVPFTAEWEIGLPGGKKTARGRMKSPFRTVLSLPLRGVPVGWYPVTLRVKDDAGRVLGSYQTTLRKEPPPPPGIHVVKADRDRRIILLDDKPFFPIGMIGVPPEQMKTFAETGFNMTCRWGGGGGSKAFDKITTRQEWKSLLDPFLDAAHQQGLYVLEVPWCFSSWDLHYGGPEFGQNMDAFIEDRLPVVVSNSATHPAVIGVDSMDEPSLQYKPWCDAWSETVRKTAPYHANWLLYASRVGWRDGYDIAMVDMYPWVVHTFIEIYRRGELAAKTAEEYCVPYVCIPVAERWSHMDRIGIPAMTGAMQQAQTYLVLIGGAKGVFWWVWPQRYHDNWEVTKRLVREMTALAPILLEPKPRQKVVHKNQLNNDTLQAVVKTFKGKTYLIAANPASVPLKAKLLLPSGYRSKAKVWFEERTVPVRKGIIADSFDRYARHVYELEGTWPEGATLTLEVEVEEQPPVTSTVATQAEDEVPPTNLIRNPGFESTDFWVLGRVTTDRHGGKQAASLSVGQVGGSTSCTGWKTALDPNTSYVFGGWMKAVGGRVTLMLRGVENVSIDAHDRTGWGRYKVTFLTGNEPVTVYPECVLRGEGAGWLDDLFLYPQQGQVRNVIKNSGFERDFSFLPGWPDNWGPGSISEPGFVGGGPESAWTVDGTVVMEGKRSLRMRWIGPPPEKYTLGTSASQRISLKPGEDWVFSCYLKTDTPEQPVYIRAGWFQQQRFTISEDWQRYVLPVKVGERGCGFFDVTLLGPGTLWLDAVQVERGTQATEYQGDK